MGNEKREYRRAAVAAARTARDSLAEAMSAIQLTAHPAPQLKAIEAGVSHVIRRLFSAEAQTPEGALEVLRASQEALQDLLEHVQDIEHPDQAVESAMQALARTLAVLYPAHQELERVLSPNKESSRGCSSIPLGRLPDRRGSPRVEVDVDIGFQSETNFYTGFSGNISDGGILIATYDVLPIGTPLTVSFVLPGGRQVTAAGRVSWIREPLHLQSDMQPGMGVAFESLSAEDLDAITGYIRKRAPLFYED